MVMHLKDNSAAGIVKIFEIILLDKIIGLKFLYLAVLISKLAELLKLPSPIFSQLLLHQTMGKFEENEYFGFCWMFYLRYR